MWYDSLRFGVDWVNVRVDCDSLNEFVTRICDVADLDINQWMPMRSGQNFYPNTLTYTPAGFSAITLSYSLLEDGSVPINAEITRQYGILVSISGDGCRFLDGSVKDGLRQVLKICQSYPHNCTRLDVCMDILDKDNPIIPLFADFCRVAYDSDPGHIGIKANMARKPGYVRWMPVFDSDIGEYTHNVYIGDRTSSKGSCCVYNKKVEIREGRLSQFADKIFAAIGVTDYWYRVEYRAKNQVLCNTSFEAACEGDACNVFYYMADNLFVFIDQIYDLHNISRCPENEVWKEFIGYLSALSEKASFSLVELEQEVRELTSTPFVKASVGRLVNWMKRNASLIYNIRLMQDRYPEFFSQVLDAGEIKRRRSGRYDQFDEEFNTITSLDQVV